MIASSWLPAAWFLFRSAGTSLPHAAAQFAVGYLAFIAVYEIGYLANDVWDARRSELGRKRMAFEIHAPYALLFGAIRLSTWLAVGWLTGWISDPIWLAGYGALVFAFSLHNLIAAHGLRSASFFQLATLRFALPVIAATPAGDRLTLLLVALIYYTYFRFLSYLESKDLLRLRERRLPRFGVSQTAMLLPLGALIALISGSTVVVELWAYFLAIYLLWSISTKKRARQDPGIP